MTDPKMPAESAFLGVPHTAFDGLFFLTRCQQRDRLTTLIRQAMTVEVQRRSGRAVPQEHTHRLKIHTYLQQSCGKTVTQRMEMNACQTNRCHESGKAPLQRAWFGSMGGHTKDKLTVSTRFLQFF